LNLANFVETNLHGGNIKEQWQKRTGKPAPNSPITLVANPARTKREVRRLTVMSLGLENNLPRHKKTDEFVKWGKTINEIVGKDKSNLAATKELDQLEFGEEEVKMAVTRRFLEGHPTHRNDELI
jgi:hypothetical protein